MAESAAKTQPSKAPAVATYAAASQSSAYAPAEFTDNRPAAVAQRQQQAQMNHSPRVQQAAASQAMIGQSPRMQQAAQLRAIATAAPVQRQEAPAPVRQNNTGLPDELKAGVENLSGHSLDDVQVHYNSAKPAQLQAHAYAQGTDIHVAPGQEQHLPHEAWHVAQQKQGRVRPTMQLKGVGVNDDSGLEREADVMGEQAVQRKADLALETPTNAGLWPAASSNMVVQRVAFNAYLPQLQEQVVYRLIIEEEEVIAQYLGTEPVVGPRSPIKCWFGNVRRRKADTEGSFWQEYSRTSNFYINSSDKFEITEFDSARSSIRKGGFSPIAIDWQAELAAYSPRGSKDWKYENITSASIKWLPTGAWQTIDRERTGHVITFPALETDLLVENSAAYVKGDCLVLLYEPEQTAGFRFVGNRAEIIRLLAFKYANLNLAAEPRSGKARAAADSEHGTIRAPAPGEAAYGAATKEPASLGAFAKGKTTIAMTSSETGSKVVVEHKGPWNKGDRGAGQMSAMGGQNAKNYVVNRLPNEKGDKLDALRRGLIGRFEWLHVVGSSLGGLNVQENLVAGSYDANTKMIALEHRVARWGTRDYAGEHAPTATKPLRITGEAETVRGTRIGRAIKLSVEHGGQELATGEYNVNDQTVITKSQYAAEENRVDQQIKSAP